MYDRTHSRDIADYGGVVNTMPRFAALMMVFTMANCGLPATQRLRGRIHGDPGRRAIRLLDRAGRRDDAGAGRGVFALDVKRVIFGAVANSTVAGSPTPIRASCWRSGCWRPLCWRWHLSAAADRRDACSVGQLLTQVGHSKLP